MPYCCAGRKIAVLDGASARPGYRRRRGPCLEWFATLLHFTFADRSVTASKRNGGYRS